jgi:hypothetical protein
MTLRLRKIELYLEKDRIMKFGPSKNKILWKKRSEEKWIYRIGRNNVRKSWLTISWWSDLCKYGQIISTKCLVVSLTAELMISSKLFKTLWI